MFQGGEQLSVGNLTVPANKSIPPVGAIVEVRYRHWFVGGGLCEPVFLAVRSDIDASECDVATLKVMDAA
jgi:bifunctional non-homologous end joining protein LigD